MRLCGFFWVYTHVRASASIPGRLFHLKTTVERINSHSWPSRMLWIFRKKILLHFSEEYTQMIYLFRDDYYYIRYAAF